MAKKKKSRLVSRRRAPVGSPPGTLLPDEGASPTSVRLTIIEDDAVEHVPDASIAVVERTLRSDKRVWVDVIGLADLDYLKAIGELFSIDPLALEDIAKQAAQRQPNNAG